jgi:hypothetical protein
VPDTEKSPGQKILIACGSPYSASQTFVTALVTNMVIGGVEVGLFILLKDKFKRIYRMAAAFPSLQIRKTNEKLIYRTENIPHAAKVCARYGSWAKLYDLTKDFSLPFRTRVPQLPTGLFQWIYTVLKHDSREIIHKNGLDAYVFVHYLKLMLWIFIPFTMISWPVLLAVDTANSGGTRQGLDRFSEFRLLYELGFFFGLTPYPYSFRKLAFSSSSIDYIELAQATPPSPQISASALSNRSDIAPMLR